MIANLDESAAVKQLSSAKSLPLSKFEKQVSPSGSRLMKLVFERSLRLTWAAALVKWNVAVERRRACENCRQRFACLQRTVGRSRHILRPH